MIKLRMVNLLNQTKGKLSLKQTAAGMGPARPLRDL
jgi:hypothetical protein